VSVVLESRQDTGPDILGGRRMLPTQDRRVRTLVGAFLLAAVLVSGSSAAAPATLKLVTSTAKPVVDQPWRWTVSARSASGKPLPAKMRLQILLGETVVGCWKGKAMVQCLGAGSGTWIPFKGKKTGVLTWPAQSIGAKLTFQAVVVTGGRTRKLRAPVTVQQASPPPPTTTTTP